MTRSTLRRAALAALVLVALAQAVAPVVHAARAEPGGTATAAPHVPNHGGGSAYAALGDESHPLDPPPRIDEDGAFDADLVERALDAVASGGDVPGVLLAAGYQRDDATEALENARRAELYGLIDRRPGVRLADAVEETGSHESTVRYHARVLEEAGLVRSALIWGQHRFYPAAVPIDEFELLAAFEDDRTAAIIDAVDRLEPTTASALADELDRAISTVSHHLARLEAVGAVDRERDGRSVIVRLETTPERFDGGD
ncbi:winged helix-turn-helix transcriptional regulator [Halegenticoccus soli]|uniref:winged helix-turn-helix transcriptional regulator n=1 Tax=Halegenticoccus soli TaxID=1985678 RepID=UPI000C6D7864|nr:helix-turn-helix domain-containing protein [Halegenticoccus soli]